MRLRRAARSLAGAARQGGSGALHIARGETIAAPATRMASVGPDDAAIARRALGDPRAPELRGAPRALEHAFASRADARHAVALASGRVAFSACLDALGIAAGDEVVVPAYTCRVVVNAIRFAGAEPVYADIELDTFGLDAEAASAAFTDRTAAVLIHHLYGLVSRDAGRVAALARERGARVIEDCAQAMGARMDGGRHVGSLGDAAFHSTGAGKVLEAGMGGLATTDDDDVAHGLRAYRDAADDLSGDRVRDVLTTYLLDYSRFAAPGRWWRGPASDLVHGARRVAGATPEELIGRKPADYAGRMPEAVAAIALNQLAKLDEVGERRRARAAAWTARLRPEALAGPLVMPGSLPAFPSFPVMVEPGMKRSRRWAFERYGVDLVTCFSEPPEPAASRGNPVAARAYAGCVGFPTGSR
jgi:dTDP-4-amino-4,6-dideoxygalactose transaminase